jgi:hypothetical protein
MAWTACTTMIPARCRQWRLESFLSGVVLLHKPVLSAHSALLNLNVSAVTVGELLHVTSAGKLLLLLLLPDGCRWTAHWLHACSSISCTELQI